jgi:5-methylcytosine-specific restriction endonuclease McrA
MPISKELYAKQKRDNYKSELTNIEWVKKRHFIKQRDNNECNNCQSKVNLQVHHTLYFDNKKLWEYDDLHLITLCKKCHELEHKLFGIGNFIRSVKYSNDILKKINDGEN